MGDIKEGERKEGEEREERNRREGKIDPLVVFEFD